MHSLGTIARRDSSNLFRRLRDLMDNALIRIANLAYSFTSGDEVTGLATDRKDWLLAAIARAESDGLSPIQIQKTMFLLKMEAGKHVGGSSFYSFEPYNYGPFSPVIYRDIEALEMAGLVRQENSGSYSRVVATNAGRTEAKRLKLNDEGKKYLHSMVKWVMSVSFNQLLRAIYGKYPKYAVNSVFRH